LIDFGVAEQGKDGKPVKSTAQCGSGCYMAPEVKRVGEPGYGAYGFACDWFSLGVLLYELQEKAWPFGASPVYTDVGNEFVNPLLLDVDGSTEIPHMFDLLSGLLDWAPKGRLGGGAAGSKDVIAHPYWGEADWELIANARMRSPLIQIARQRLDAWENKEKVDLDNARRHSTHERRLSFEEAMEVSAKLAEARSEQQRLDEFNKGGIRSSKSDRSSEMQKLAELEIEMQVDDCAFNSHNAIADEYVESHADVVSIF